jgi:hypothetical protein
VLLLTFLWMTLGRVEGLIGAATRDRAIEASDSGGPHACLSYSASCMAIWLHRFVRKMLSAAGEPIAAVPASKESCGESG